MPNSTRETVLCRYHYDPLDRQNGCTVQQQPPIQHFHCKNRLATEIQGAARWCILQHDEHLLAQQNHLDAKVSTTLLATDLQRSVLNALDATQPNPLAYTPYGHRPAENGLLSLLGFNGERPDPVTGHYHLGNGYRQFNPVLMRFNSPDSWSPFGEGGLNAYAYCEGSPSNLIDPTGHFGFKSLLSYFWGPASSASSIDPLKEITRGAKVMSGRTTLVHPLENSTAATIQLNDYKDNVISQLSSAINTHSSKVYDDKVRPKLFSGIVPFPENAIALRNRAIHLVDNHSITRNAVLSSRRVDQIDFLQKVIVFHRNLMEARKITKRLPYLYKLEHLYLPQPPQALAQIPNADQSTMNTRRSG
jgi:RHS repeat-associated protein